jgi:hypothetical protein
MSGKDVKVADPEQFAKQAMASGGHALDPWLPN